MRTIAVMTVAVIAVAGALSLAGCAPAVHVAGPTPSASVTVSPSPTPTPTRPALSELVVTPDGLGYLIAGQAVPAEPAAVAIVTYDATKCVAPALGIAAGSPGAGAWIPSYSIGDTSLGSGLPFDVGPVLGPTDPIHQIEIWSPELQTAQHVGVGSTVVQLTAAYGSTLVVDTADNSDVYVLRGSRTELLFEVAKDASGLPADEIGTVVWMRIVPLDASYLHIANTDAAGACSV